LNVKPLAVKNLENKVQNLLSTAASASALSGETSPLVVSAQISNLFLPNLIKVEENVQAEQCKEFEYHNPCGSLNFLQSVTSFCKPVKVCKKVIGKL